MQLHKTRYWHIFVFVDYCIFATKHLYENDTNDNNVIKNFDTADNLLLTNYILGVEII